MPDLDAAAARKTLRLVTRGRKTGQPRAVTVWFVASGPRSVRVQHVNRAPAQWYRNLLQNPDVEVDFGDGPRPARARPLEDRSEIESVLREVRRKYWSAWLVQTLFGRGATPVAAELNLTD